MKPVVWVFLLLAQAALYGQATETNEVRASIDRFFEGMHTRDTSLMRGVLSETALLQTIGRTPEGTAALRSEKLSDFMKSVASIPDTVAIREELLSYDIKIDGDMAHAWTPYEFYLRDEFSHCGVNSFQLFRSGDGWKIIYIVDTRRREGCK